MKIAIASDHAGYDLKMKVKKILASKKHEVIDYGTDSKESVDYPDFGVQVAEAVAKGLADYGITVCWTGNGMNMVTNKVKGVRAGMGLSRDMAFYTRAHNNANVLTLAQKYVDVKELEEIIETFLTTEFEGGRHTRRVDKISKVEQEACSAT